LERRIFTLRELSDLIGGELVGDGEVEITGVAGIEEAGEGDITFVAEPRFGQLLKTTGASAVIRKAEFECALPSIVSGKPHLAFVEVLSLFDDSKELQVDTGVHDTASIDPSAELGDNNWIGPFCWIGRNVRLGANTKVHSGTFVGERVVIGNECLIHPNVTIREGCAIGDRVILHPGVVIGSDGFGFTRDGDRHVKIPQIGTVVIEDDVEIGSNSTVDRATTGVTRVCEGTKIDNLVHIAHNCKVGRGSILAGQVGIAGSATLGEGVILGGQAGVADHVTVGDRVIAGARSGLLQPVREGRTVSGFPAREHSLMRKIYAYSARLPELYKRIRDLEERIAGLEKEKGHGQAAEDDC
jgi:UDP-3-O-[3-hydroxymyristoyl] glucosamine N-acyltransferase